MTAAWTPEQILALAPDASSAKSGKELSNARKWVALHHDAGAGSDGAVWGECQGSGKDPYRTQIDLAEPAFKCSCPSRKFPCKHGLGLLLLFAGQSQAFSAAPLPAWVSEWLESRAARVQKQSEKAEKQVETATADPKAQEKRLAAREKKVAAGVSELELWLRDMMRRGLATAESDWDKMAARLVDAQASGLARMVREASAISLSGDGWQERLLERLARLHLLIEAWKRLETLAPEMQAEVRSQIGWTQNQDELLAQDGVRDIWLVLGRRIEEDERLRTARTWLWGQNSRRTALVLDFAPSGRPLELSLAPGMALEGEMVFFAGTNSQRAIVKSRAAVPAFEALPGYEAIGEALADCAAQRARNPWQSRCVLSLQRTTVVPDAKTWLLRDAQNHALPLAPRFASSDASWKLLALTGGHATGLVGEWDGDHLFPLAAWTERGLVQF